jgi:hypothetical protein
VPVVEILGEINLLSGPERGLGLLVHLPDLYACRLACESRLGRLHRNHLTRGDASTT